MSPACSHSRDPRARPRADRSARLEWDAVGAKSFAAAVRPSSDVRFGLDSRLVTIHGDFLRTAKAQPNLRRMTLDCCVWNFDVANHMVPLSWY